MQDKTADLAGPGIGTYEELETLLPDDCQPALSRRETQQALFAAKEYIEKGLRHELNLMMVQVSGQQDFLELPYRQAILNDEIPLSIGGGIGQSRTYMLLLRAAHLGEVSVTVWPDQLKEICAARNIHVLE